jgi:hypothetical protein
MLPKRITKPTEKVLAMAMEDTRTKRKATDSDKGSTSTVASKRTKVTASVDVEQTRTTNKGPSSTSYRATVCTEEEELARADTITIDSDVSDKSDIEVEDPGESSETELSMYIVNELQQQANHNVT